MKKFLTIAALWLVLAPPAWAAPAQVTAARVSLDHGQYRLTWSTNLPRIAVDVYAARAEDAPAPQWKLVLRHDIADEATIADPFGAPDRPYFYVVPEPRGRQGAWAATRVVPLQGAANFRDLGGYQTADGHHVVWGELFRSNALAALTDQDYRLIDRLHIKLVVDLRTAQERQSAPTRWQGVPPQFVLSPKLALNFNTRALFGPQRPSAARVRATMTAFYQQMPEAYAGEFRIMFRHLLAGDVPMIMHCTAGKDRTGMGSALLLLALGVPRATVVDDYSISGELLYARQASEPAAVKKRDPLAGMIASLPPDVRQALLASDPAYINAALDSIIARHGSIDAYLQQKLGVGPAERAKLRQLYLR